MKITELKGNFVILAGKGEPCTAAYKAAKRVLSGERFKDRCLGAYDFGESGPVTDMVSYGVACSDRLLGGHKRLMLYSVPEIPKGALTVRPGDELPAAHFYVVFYRDEYDILAAAYCLEASRVPFDRVYAADCEFRMDEDLHEALFELEPFSGKLKEVAAWLEDCHYRPELIRMDRWGIREIQEALKMTNREFCAFFGMKLRTLENWRQKPESCPEYVRDLIIQVSHAAFPYLEDKYGSEWIDPVMHLPEDVARAQIEMWHGITVDEDGNAVVTEEA